MGADYTAGALIGIRVDPTKLYREKQEKAFKHSYPLDWKVCPKTGRELWRTVREPIDGAVSRYEGEDASKIGPYDVTYGTDHETAFICIVSTNDTYSNAGNDCAMVSIPVGFNIVEEKEKLRETLEPLGLWDEKLFGLWTVLYCSY